MYKYETGENIYLCMNEKNPFYFDPRADPK